MEIFISYSTPDLDLVQKVGKAIESSCVVRYWDKDKSLGEDAWATIFKWIDSSDLVITIITGSTVSRAMAIGQEIGRAKARGKLIIPLVDKDVPKTELGCLDGVTYEPFSRENIDHAVQRVKHSVEELRHRKDRQVAFLILGLIIGLVFLSSE
jgi:hypothetical protein